MANKTRRLGDWLLEHPRWMSHPAAPFVGLAVNVWLQTALEFDFAIRLVLNTLIALVAVMTGLNLGRRWYRVEHEAQGYLHGYHDAIEHLGGGER